MSTRIRTQYPGVFSREVSRLGGPGTERVFYIVFKKGGRVYEEKAGRQYADDMTPARAARIRADRIEGRRKSKKELREIEKARTEAEAARSTIDRLWNEYRRGKPENKNLRTDMSRYERHLKADFGDKEPKDILPLDLDRVRVRLSKTHAPQTVKHVVTLLQRIVNFGVNRGLCGGLGFKPQKPSVDNVKTEMLADEEMGRLLEALDQEPDVQVSNLVRLVMYTGIRRGEAFKLKWADVDFQTGFIRLQSPKGGKSATIPMNTAARELLEHHPRTGSEYVFPGRAGGQRTDAYRVLRRIKSRAGLPKDFRILHGLRHHYASILASSGQVDMYTLQKLLTHKNPMMTQRYAHLRDDALRRASELAGALITESVTRNGSASVK